MHIHVYNVRHMKREAAVIFLGRWHWRFACRSRWQKSQVSESLAEFPVFGYWLDNKDSSLSRVGFFFSWLQCSDSLWIPSASYAMITGGFCPGSEQLECKTYHYHPSRAIVYNAMSFIFTLHICLHGVILRHKGRVLLLSIHLCYSWLYVLVAAYYFLP
jgi:hypothetical protein